MAGFQRRDRILARQQFTRRLYARELGERGKVARVRELATGDVVPGSVLKKMLFSQRSTMSSLIRAPTVLCCVRPCRRGGTIECR